MKPETIEDLLRKAPRITPPDGLLATLKRDATLPTVEFPSDRRSGVHSGSWLRRWLPATAFAAWFLGCVIVFGYQASRIHDLEQQQAAANARPAASQQSSTAPDQPSSPALPDETRQNQTRELERLRSEVAQLRKDAAELATLRSENTRLRAQIQAQAPAAAQPDKDFFMIQKEQASRAVCVNRLKQLALAARLHANDSQAQTLASQLSALTPYAPQDGHVFECSDNRTPFQLVSPGASVKNSQVAYLRCPVHNNVALVDGSVQSLKPDQRLVETANGLQIEK